MLRQEEAGQGGGFIFVLSNQSEPPFVSRCHTLTGYLLLMDFIPSVREEPGGCCSCWRNSGGKGQVASADRAQSLYRLHLGHRYVMTHLSAFSRPCGWMAFCEEEPLCHSAQATWLEGAHTSPPSPGLGCTHTHAHSHSHTRVGPPPWGGTGGIPPCQTTSPDHKVMTWTDNRQSHIVAQIYTFLKKKFFMVYSSCPGWLHAFNPHRNPARLVVLVSSFQAGQQGPEGSCAFSKFQGWGDQAGARGSPCFQQWCHLPLAASSYTTSLT